MQAPSSHKLPEIQLGSNYTFEGVISHLPRLPHRSREFVDLSALNLIQSLVEPERLQKLIVFTDKSLTN
jgi:hypothetical protein